MRTLALLAMWGGVLVARTPFWAPVEPPRAQYRIDASISNDATRLDGTAVISFRNTTKRPIGRLDLPWHGTMSVRVSGTTAVKAPGTTSLYDLPRDVEPGEAVALEVTFSAPWRMDPESNSAVTSSLAPRLEWGFGTHSDYEVKLTIPEGYAAATSGRFDPATGVYKAGGVRAFGLFLGKGYESADADAGATRVRAVFTAKGRPCAEKLLATAVDAITFYRERFGFYPHNSLSIVPGMDSPSGGYPVSNALVVVHGQERLSSRPENFWRWITAHEIGHQYWMEHVLTKGYDALDWLTVGLGIHADREYRRARNIDNAGDLRPNYMTGVVEGIDTTIDLTAEQQERIKFDFNNIVEHGKSASMMNALESVMGAEAFDRVYRRILHDYAGKRLDWRGLQAACESEIGEDLEWFFGQWVRSSRNLSYRVVGQDCTEAGSAFDCTVRVERTGPLQMPVPILARFEDGSEQRESTERLAAIDEIRFRANARLNSVVVDPDRVLAMADAPPDAEREIRSKIRDLSWTGSGDEALPLYRKAVAMKLSDRVSWMTGTVAVRRKAL